MLFNGLSDTFLENFALIYGLICILISSIYLVNLHFYSKLVYTNPSQFSADRLTKDIKRILLKKYGDKMNYTHSHLFINDPLIYKRLQRTF
ncbi:hypothetical protein Bcell_4285 [Evansella cellulosilytica DSM 2522]|uniref:Uncharacterized protein n=1 Tax=Evansella cellulosilytica (strain ATCC 21833 / DSM 2522 / FERM P-1141 / JCM 9156 / N-4) TaxID=649639 RepID=E6TZU6_EVAC2|nr:hypothetical protein Bcell_4285 [Evansella cellulosilytica DSM 2522]